LRYPGFIGPSYTLDSKDIDNQRVINWYPKINEMGRGKSDEVASFICTPGLSTLVTLPGGAYRGSYRATNGFLYAVGGNKLYFVNSSWVATELGELQTSSGQVDFADNGSTLVVVDGPNGYWHTFSSNTITQFTGGAWLGSTRVNYIDGYFLFNDPDTGKFYISGLSSVSLDALDFASADGAPDNIIATLVNHREVWLFGEDSIEAWYNSGNPDFPFERIGGGFLEMGCAAAFSVAKIDKRTLWLGKNEQGHGIVYMAQGFMPQRISTHAVELAIQSYGDISDAVAWTYQENGHYFYVLNFTSADTTWAYDLTTGLWHERAYFTNGQYQRHRANGHAFAYGVHVVGDYANGNLYKLDSSVYTDAGQPIRRMRIPPHISNGRKRAIYHSVEIEAEVGVGLPSGQGSDPQMMMQFSDDGGHTWSNERWAPLGKIGQRDTRALWRRLGASRRRLFRFVVTDPVKANLVGCELEVEALAS
tara:strand:- start:15951 stop:17378 length:1428 start_codon:yes stop_codon:yes gene_type:complete